MVGVVFGDVKVLVVIYIMILNVFEVCLLDIENVVLVIGYGFDWIDGDEDILLNFVY